MVNGRHLPSFSVTSKEVLLDAAGHGRSRTLGLLLVPEQYQVSPSLDIELSQKVGDVELDGTL